MQKTFVNYYENEILVECFYLDVYLGLKKLFLNVLLNVPLTELIDIELFVTGFAS